MTARDENHRIYIQATILVLAGLSTCTTAWGMTFGGTVYSDVSNVTASGVSGVSVEAKGTLITHMTQTDSQGRWAFVDVPTDVYEVRFSKEGYDFYLAYLREPRVPIESIMVFSDELEILVLALPTPPPPPPPPVPDGQPDQNNVPPWTGGVTHINPYSDDRPSMWQTFTPSVPLLTAVEVDILTLSPGRGDDVLTVEIAQAGQVLASTACFVWDGYDGLFRFVFPKTVNLVPGTLYDLRVRDTGKNTFGWRYGGDDYARGSRYVLAKEDPATDWFFKTFAGSMTTLTYTDDIGRLGINWCSPEAASVMEAAPAGVMMPPFKGRDHIYGFISLGDSRQPAFCYAVDLLGTEGNLKAVEFYFDRNHNANLADDGPPMAMPAGASGKVASFDVPYRHGVTRPYSLCVYVYYSAADRKYHVLYYRDCGWTGDITIGSKTQSVLLLDDNSDGLYYDSKGTDCIGVDSDGDGIFAYEPSKGEILSYRDPVIIGERAYSVGEVSIDGTSALFRETPRRIVSGTVRSAVDGVGIENAKVEVWSSVRLETLTDRGGSFTLNVPEGKWHFRASKPGYLPNLKTGIGISGDQPVVIDVNLAPMPSPNSGSISLRVGDSYDFATGQRGMYSGGDFYVATGPAFFANNLYQRGLIDLGSIGKGPLEAVVPPAGGYTRFGCVAVLGHTYVSLAREGEEGCYIIFRVVSLSSDSVAIEYSFIMR